MDAGTGLSVPCLPLKASISKQQALILLSNITLPHLNHLRLQLSQLFLLLFLRRSWSIKT